MRINTHETSLLIINPTREELEKVMQMVQERDVLKEQKGMRVYGTPEQLYKLLHRLSFTFDLEL